MKIVINKCYGGFGLSQAAYEKLIEWGVPVLKYERGKRDPRTGLDIKNPEYDKEVILQGGLSNVGYWEAWLSANRTHPLLIRVVEELGEAASDRHAQLKVVEIPDGTEWEINDYDGIEHIAEKHNTWG